MKVQSTECRRRVVMSEKRTYTVKERARIGRNAGLVGIAVNLVLFAMKLALGIVTGSVSVIADAVNNLSDAGSSILVLIGYVLSAKPADRKHPYGHARIEYLITLFISVIIAALGFDLLKSSVESLSGGKVAEFGTVSVVVMAASVLLKLFLALYFKVVGKKISSASLSASSVDSIGDMAATAAVVIGMLLSPYLGSYVDGVLGCAIAVYIIVLGVKLIKESSDTILGTAPDAELVMKIVSKLRSYDGVLGIHDLVMHNYGEGRFFASVHVEMDAAGDIMLSHDLIDNIETDFMRDMGIHMVIHFDPVCVGDGRVDALKEKLHSIIDGLSSSLSSPISMHDFRAVFGVTHTNLIFDVVVSNELPISEAELCDMIRSELSKTDPTLNAVITVDRDYTSSIY